MIIILLIFIIAGIILMLLPLKLSVNYFRVNNEDSLKIKAEALFGIICYRLELSYIKIQRKFLLPFLELHAELFGAKGKKRDDEILQSFGLHTFNLKQIINTLKYLLKMTDQYEALLEMLETFKKEDKSDQKLHPENVVIFRIMGALFMGLKGDCQKLNWETKYGFEDAAVTGITNGLIWAGKSIFLDIISNFCNFKTVPLIKVEPDFKNPGFDTRFESIFSIRMGNIMFTGLKILLKGYKRRAK